MAPPLLLSSAHVCYLAALSCTRVMHGQKKMMKQEREKRRVYPETASGGFR